MATIHAIYYKISDLLNRTDREVLYKTRKKDQRPGAGNNSIIDAEAVIKDYLGSISAEIADKWISPLSRGLSELEEPVVAYEFDATFNEDETGIDNCIIFRVVFPEKYDTNVIPSLVRAIEDCIISYCVWQWLFDADVKDWQKYEQEHIRKLDNLRGLANRRMNLKRTYKLF